MTLGEIERGSHGTVVGVDQAAVASDQGQGRDRLGRAHRAIPTRCVLAGTGAGGAENLSCGQFAFEQGDELAGIDLAVEAKGLGTAPVIA